MRVPSDFSASEGTAAPDSVQRFCAHTTPYLPEAHTDAQFIAAMRDLTRWHQQRSPWYRALLAQQGVQVDALTTLDDLVALPPVHANFFKQHEVLSVPEDAVALHLTSSGTTGQKSQMFFDAFTIGNARRMVDDVMQARGVASSTPANYLVNAYEPYEGLRVGTSNTNQYLMRYAPPAKVFWSLRAVGEGQHEFDAFGALAALQDYAQDGVPARIIGFHPAPARRQLRDLRWRLERPRRPGHRQGRPARQHQPLAGHRARAHRRNLWRGGAQHSLRRLHPPPPARAHVVARAGARRANPRPRA